MKKYLIVILSLIYFSASAQPNIDTIHVPLAIAAKVDLSNYYKKSSTDSIATVLRREIQVAASNGGVTKAQLDSAANLKLNITDANTIFDSKADTGDVVKKGEKYPIGVIAPLVPKDSFNIRLDSLNLPPLRLSQTLRRIDTDSSIVDKKYVDSSIAGASGAVINDATSSTTTTYSSNKTESLLSAKLDKSDSTATNRITNLESIVTNTQDFDPATKADLTKVQSDSSTLQAAIALKANKSNPALTGTGTINGDTLATKNDIKKLPWVKEYANDSVAVVDGGLGLNSIYQTGGYLRVVTTLPSSPLLTNITAYYKLDESSGSAVDQISANNGTVSGATYSATGKVNTAYQMDGTGGIALPNNSTFIMGTKNFSLSMWVYITALPTGGGIALFGGQQNGFGLNVQTTDMSLRVQKVYESAGPQSSSNIIQLNTWQFITCTLDSATNLVTFYLNGTSVGSGTYVKDFTGATNLIGMAIDPNQNVIGKIDEIGYWGRVLTPTEISTLYNSGAGKSYPF